MLGFLKRDEIEKFQMVSRQWNCCIINCTCLPLRMIKNVSYVPSYSKFHHQQEGFRDDAIRRLFFSKRTPSKHFPLKGLVGKDTQVHGLRNAVVGKITLGADEKSKEMMRKLYLFNDNEKIRCKTINLHNFYSGEYEKQLNVNLIYI